MDFKKTILVMGGIFGVFVMLWVLVGYLTVARIEKPRYEVLEKKRDYEVRRYDGYILASTFVEREDGESFDDLTNKGFRILADYIFGNNSTGSGEVDVIGENIAMTSPVIQQPSEVSEEIAMTSPVVQSKGEMGYWMSFVMPSKYTMESLPTPNNDRIKLEEVSEFKAAVLGFSWFVSESRLNKKINQLRESVENDGFEIMGEARIARYDPPWTPPFMRTNEIWFEVK